MTLRLPKAWRDPYLDFDSLQVARAAAACLQCGAPAPCTLACGHQTDIPRVMRLAGQAACEGLALTRWFWGTEQIEAARIADAITDSYN
ncbi:MAG: hypothetical protein MUO23_08255 [Anaerolineales bacterium]|nr:hypothetical protein [Anaerolineales bacterium]